MKTTWADNAIFYHIYPLGLTGAPEQNDLSKPDDHRMEMLYPWLDHMQKLESAPFIWDLFFNPPGMAMTQLIITGLTGGWETTLPSLDLQRHFILEA